MIDLLPGERLDNGLIVAESERGYATFSIDRRFRYCLERWITPRSAVAARDADRLVTFVMLNPSTADAFVDDPTIRKCLKFAKREGADTMRVVNLFALRATNPAELGKVGSREFAGADQANWIAVRASVIAACTSIAAWGTHGHRFDQHRLIRGVDGALDGIELHHLGLSKDGYPKHPLYRRDDQELTPWR